MFVSSAAVERPLQYRQPPLFTSNANVRLTQPILPLQFGLQADSIRSVQVDPLTGRIDSDIYKLLTLAPKSELHIHQGGSTSVEFIIYCYRNAAQNRSILQYLGPDHTMPIYHRDGSVERVSLVDGHGQLLPPKELSVLLERILTLENMREYLRIASIHESQRSLIPNRELAETTSNGDAQASHFDVDALNRIKKFALNEYRFTTGKMNPFNRNPAAAYLLANQYARDVILENVRYTEYRVSLSGNGLGGNNGVDAEETLSAVDSGFRDAKEYLGQRLRPFDYGLIVLLERQNRSTEDSPEKRIERAKHVAEEVVRLKKEGKYNLVGVDLAGDEANNPVTEFAEAFKVIQDYNKSAPPDKRLGITIHAGETAESNNPAKGIHLQGWQSVEQAVRLGHDDTTPMRVGHGLQIIHSSPALKQAFETYLAHPNDWKERIDIQAVYDQSPLLQYIRDKEITLEMCPKSNVQTYGIHPGFVDAPDDPDDKYTIRSYKRHPAVFLSRLGIKIAISADNRTVSRTDAPNEYVKLYKYAGMTYQDFKRMVFNGFEAAFIPEYQKSLILEEVHRHFEELEREPSMIRAIRKMDGHVTPWQHVILIFEQLRKTFLNLYRQGLSSYHWLRGLRDTY